MDWCTFTWSKWAKANAILPHPRLFLINKSHFVHEPEVAQNGTFMAYLWGLNIRTHIWVHELWTICPLTCTIIFLEVVFPLRNSKQGGRGRGRELQHLSTDADQGQLFTEIDVIFKCEFCWKAEYCFSCHMKNKYVSYVNFFYVVRVKTSSLNWMFTKCSLFLHKFLSLFVKVSL